MSLQSTTEFIASPVGAIPANKKCPYCGKQLKTTLVNVLGKTYSNLPCFGHCGCEKSRKRIKVPTYEGHPCRCPECGGTAYPDGFGVCDCKYCGYSFMAKSVIDEMNESREFERLESVGGLMASVGVPAIYRSVEPDTDLAEKIASTRKGYFFHGGSGTYKTVKAASIARAFLDMGKSVLFVKSTELVSKFRDAMNDGSEFMVLNSFIAPDLLVIDDLGKEQDTEWAVTTLFRVIDGRYGDGGPIVVTSNFERGELAAIFSSSDVKMARAIASRLAEMTDTVDFGNKDRRLQ